MNKISLRIKCQYLPSLDAFSKSDPFVVVYENDGGSKKFHQIGNTESIKNDNNPKFIKTVAVNYIPSVCKKIKMDIFDKDCNSNKLMNHHYFGHSIFSLNELMQGPKTQPIVDAVTNNHMRNIQNKKSYITVSVETFVPSDSLITIQLRGIKLKKKDLFSSDPFFLIQRQFNGKWSTVYTSEVIKKDLNPHWNQAKIDSVDLCGNNYNETLKLQCYDYDKNSKNDLIGEFEFKLADLQQSKRFSLLKAKYNKKQQGYIEVCLFKQEKIYSFEDYVRFGLDISTIITIDFSSQNVQTHSPNSLHHLGGFNEYESALRTCFGSIQRIDSDQMLPIWGFCAGVGGNVSHCFSLTFNPEVPKVRGIEEVISTYKNALRQVRMSQPKILSELLGTIQTLVQRKISGTQGMNYFVLFVFICEGNIADMTKTKDLVVELSELPISIIFVGVGAGKFSQLSFLDDGWKSFRTSYGKPCCRDSVKLLRYRDYTNKGNGQQISEILMNQVYLAISSQALKYFKMKKINPQPIHGNYQHPQSSHGSHYGPGNQFSPINPQTGGIRQSNNHPQFNTNYPNAFNNMPLTGHPQGNYTQGNYQGGNVNPVTAQQNRGNINQPEKSLEESMQSLNLGNPLNDQTQRHNPGHGFGGSI